MIAHHSRQQHGKPVERSRSDAADESKGRQSAQIGKPALHDAFDKVRFVCLAQACRDGAVKAAVGRTLYRLPDMTKISRRRNGRYDIGAVNEAECRVAEPTRVKEIHPAGPRAA